MNRQTLLILAIIVAPGSAMVAGGNGDLGILGRPLSKVEALNIAINQNGTIRQAQKDVEAAAGVAIQTRAILFPHLGEAASYSVSQDSLIEANQERSIPFTTITLPPPIGDVTVGGGELPKTNNQVWISDLRVVQSLYEGGRLLSASRSSGLIREQAMLVYQSTVADTLLSVSNAYDDVLRAGRCRSRSAMPQ